MIKKLMNSNAGKALVYAILAAPFLAILNYLAPDAWTQELGGMPPVLQATVILTGVMSLYVLAAKPSFIRSHNR